MNPLTLKNKKNKIIVFILFLFSVYCALSIGASFDEGFQMIQGKTTLDYLFSLGKIDNHIPLRENYSTIYWSLQFLLTKIFPSSWEIEIVHLTNLLVSFSTIYGIGKISSKLFNKNVGNLTFLILFFYPIFFGHMSFNGKDTILACCHVWITYSVINYLKNQNLKTKRNKSVLTIALLGAVATGIQLVFLGSLIPIIIFALLEILLFKKILDKKFSLKKIFIDIIKLFLVFYFTLVFFWIDAHPNIFLLPFSFLLETFSSNYWTGWPYNLVNGIFYISWEVPKNYLLINFLYKSPEYILLTYFLSLILFTISKSFFYDHFKFFYYKISLILSILIFPNLILFFIPYPIYDGLRLFIWMLPYLCIIPALVFYYIYINFKNSINKYILVFTLSFFVYFVYHFIIITPYQYTYLNLLNGKKEYSYKKFENDYWGGSIKELIKNTSLNKDKIINLSTCGVSPALLKKYLKKYGYTNFSLKSADEADYIVMTNRVTVVEESENSSKKLITCYDRFDGDNLFEVRRNNLILSVIRKINN